MTLNSASKNAVVKSFFLTLLIYNVVSLFLNSSLIIRNKMKRGKKPTKFSTYQNVEKWKTGESFEEDGGNPIYRELSRPFNVIDIRASPAISRYKGFTHCF